MRWKENCLVFFPEIEEVCLEEEKREFFVFFFFFQKGTKEKGSFRVPQHVMRRRGGLLSSIIRATCAFTVATIYAHHF